MEYNGLCLRVGLKRGEHKRIREITESVNVFSKEEINIAEELASESINKGADKSGYHFILCENSAGLIGFACYGNIPGTKKRYDLYWIVIRDELRGAGIGRRLLSETEKIIQKRGGKKIYVETSSKESYYRTRRFYLKCGYIEEALLKDFYDDGDDKIIYIKYLE